MISSDMFIKLPRDVLVNLYCQLNVSPWKQSSGHICEGFLDWVKQGRKTYPNVDSTIQCARTPDSIKMVKEANTSIPPSLLPDYGHNVISHLSPCLPDQDVLHP